jgi:signal transduction histidine kinase
VAYAFVTRSARDTLEPLLGTPEGRAVYAATAKHLALAIALFDLPLLVVVGIAAYVLAGISVRPLLDAREREERFAADAAHELRTPLASIASVAQAARDAEPARAAAALATIAATALDASALIGDLLLLMRSAQTTTDLYEPVDMTTIATGVARDARERTPHITVQTDLAEAGSYVNGDARALRRLTENLVENALRHARERVNVCVRDEGTQVVLSVEDDGPGVAEPDRSRIFERFYKGAPGGAGTGLGLAICRRIAEAHSGTIILDGRARFVVRLPAVTV